MTKVITYGTYDHLHRGHVRLLERAKALGDYLIVGVTSDDFDKQRGKIVDCDGWRACLCALNGQAEVFSFPLPQTARR